MYRVEMLSIYQVEVLNMGTKWKCLMYPIGNKCWICTDGNVEYVPSGNVEYGYQVEMLNMYQVGTLSMGTKWKC